MWDELVEAHERVEVGPTDTLPVHEPRAAILACSDARVPPSVVFDQPAGTLFVVRFAGNTANPAALASLDYAVDVLGVRLLVVLGHTGCGAVQAAVSGECGGHLAPIVESICAIAKAHPELAADDIMRANVAATMMALEQHRGPVGRAAQRSLLEIRGAVHDLTSGALDSVAPEPNISDSGDSEYTKPTSRFVPIIPEPAVEAS